MAKRILVFPCGSEIGLEIHRSLRYSKHFELVGASSVQDHGRYVYEEYIDGLPFHDAPEFSATIVRIVQEYRIDAIYPAMDAVADTLKRISQKLGLVVIGSSTKTTEICASKKATYDALGKYIPVPECHPNLDRIQNYPVFIKPDRGYGSRNTFLATNAEAAIGFLSKFNPGEMLVMEYLPGDEWTVDCLSDRHGRLRFHAPRIRARVSNGISVNTRPSVEHEREFSDWAERIQGLLQPRGAWFFQAKSDAFGRPKLLEVAVRPGGSSGLFRCQGVNFALLTVFDAFGQDVNITPNSYTIEMDRALDNRYKLSLRYKHIFVDLDDCLIIRGQVNRQLISFLHKAISEEKKLTLITRHHVDPMITLRAHRISELFDRVIHIDNKEHKKSAYIDDVDAIFIDDSHAERLDVATTHGIAVFSPDMVEALL